MKKIPVMLLLALQYFFGADALASQCTTSTLSSYVSLGSTGCTIGDVTFSDFGLLQQPTNSVLFTAISVIPVALGMTTVGLDFGVDASASSGMLFEDLISYRVSGPSLKGASLNFSGSATDPDGNGAVTVVENLCIGGLFTGADGVSGCDGMPQNLGVVNSFNVADSPDSLVFMPVASLGVVTDIAIDGGAGGFASLGSASNRFQVVGNDLVPVPEPAAYLLVMAGLLGLYGARASGVFPLPRRASHRAPPVSRFHRSGSSTRRTR